MLNKPWWEGWHGVGNRIKQMLCTQIVPTAKVKDQTKTVENMKKCPEIRGVHRGVFYLVVVNHYFHTASGKFLTVAGEMRK